MLGRSSGSSPSTTEFHCSAYWKYQLIPIECLQIMIYFLLVMVGNWNYHVSLIKMSYWSKFIIAELIVEPWSSLAVENEGWIGPSRKLLHLCENQIIYATHAWHNSIVFWLLGWSSGLSPFSSAYWKYLLIPNECLRIITKFLLVVVGSWNQPHFINRDVIEIKVDHRERESLVQRATLRGKILQAKRV